MRKRVRTKLLAYTLLMPAFLVTIALMAYPLYITVALSFREGSVMNFKQLGETSLSLRNYADVLSNPSTWLSLLRAITYTAGSTLPAFSIGLGTALLLNKRILARRWLRMCVLLPWSVPGVVASISFLWILDASYGVMNYFLQSAGIISKYIAWFFDPKTAMIAVILPTIWKGYPFFTLTLLAALQSIPHSLYEAARVDGASILSQFRYITWPGIRTSAVLALILNGLWTFRVFDIIYPTTQGGPMGVTETLAIRIYNEAFQFFRMGRAATLGILAFFVCAIAVYLLHPLMKKSFY